MGSLSLLQGVFPTQGLNLGLPHCRWILYQLSHQGNPLKALARLLIMMAKNPGSLAPIWLALHHMWRPLKVKMTFQIRAELRALSFSLANIKRIVRYLEIPWQSSGWDSALSLPGVWSSISDRELRCHIATQCSFQRLRFCVCVHHERIPHSVN